MAETTFRSSRSRFSPPDSPSAMVAPPPLLPPHQAETAASAAGVADPPAATVKAPGSVFPWNRDFGEGPLYENYAAPYHGRAVWLEVDGKPVEAQFRRTRALERNPKGAIWRSTSFWVQANTSALITGEITAWAPV